MNNQSISYVLLILIACFTMAVFVFFICKNFLLNKLHDDKLHDDKLHDDKSHDDKSHDDKSHDDNILITDVVGFLEPMKKAKEKKLSIKKAAKKTNKPKPKKRNRDL
jgi:anaerobic C4-dicarboxylate transporter